MLKGWIDRVWVNGVAWELPEGANRLRPLLSNVRRIVVVTTHGSSKLVNALEGESGKRTVTRSLRTMCHPLTRTNWLALYGVDAASADRRGAFLDRVERRLARLA
jgi:putative NADPH-quinone reductase